MFNRLITRIKDSDKGKGNSSPPSPNRSSADDGQETTAEGFLCPSCMDQFASAEELQVHYEESHTDGEQRHICPVCKNAFPTTDQLQIHYTSDHALAATANRGDLQTLKQEVAELQTTLKEEKWYSEELKKEVSRLATTGSAAKDEADELMLWKQQIRALEESKSLLSSEIMLLRKQLGEAVETYTSVKVQKDQIEQKAASLAGEKVSLQAMLDEERSVRKSAESQLNELKDSKHNLEVQLQQRPEADDVRVLRQELVQVQTLMDRMTRDREAERDKLEQDNKALRTNIEKLEERLERKDDEIKRAPTTGEIESIQHMLTEKESELEALVLSLQEERDAKIALVEHQNELAAALNNKDGEINRKIEDIKELHAVNGRLEADFASFNQAVQQSEQLNGKLKQELNAVKESLQTKEADLISQQNDLSAHRQSTSQELGQKNQQISELTIQIEKLANEVVEKESLVSETAQQLSTLQAQLNDQSSASDDLKSKFRETQSELEKEKRCKLQSDEKQSELQARIDQLAETIERLEKERSDLYAKIEDGEGANTAIQQLQQEKDALLDRLSKQQSQSSQQTETLSNKCEELHNQLLQVGSLFQASSEKAAKLENIQQEVGAELTSSKDKCKHLEESLKKKVELLKTNEAMTNQLKAEYEKQFENLSIALDGSKSEVGKLTSEFARVSKELSSLGSEKDVVDGQLQNEMRRSAALKTETEDLQAELEKHQNQIALHQAALSLVESEVRRLTEELSKKQCDYVEQLKNVENLNASQQQEILRLDERKSYLETQSQQTKHAVADTCSAMLSQTEDTKRIMLTTRKECGALQQHFSDEIKRVLEEVTKLRQYLLEAQRSLTAKSESEVTLLARLKELDKVEVGLKSEISELLAKSKDQEEEIEKQKKIQSVWKQKLDKKEESSKAAQISLENSCKEVETLKDKCVDLESSLSKLQELYTVETDNLKESRAALSDEQAKTSVLLSQQQKLTLDVEDGIKQQDVLKKLIEDGDLFKKNQELTIASLNLQLGSITENLTDLNLQKSSIETELFETRKSLSDSEEKIAVLESGLEEYKNQFNLQQDYDKKLIVELQEAKDHLITQKVEMQNRLSTVENQLKQESASHQTTRETAKQTAESQQQQIKEYTSQISALKESKASIEQDAEKLKARYEMEMSTVFENLTTLKDDLIGHQDKLGKLQTRNDELTGEKLELEAKLENALDERRALLERCLNSESEWDKLKGSSVELRRKLDDALSALHEMGRENLSLQMEATKLTSRKWAKDDDVTSCLSCDKMFSVTVRKHHCRNCGNIYCNECSARSATVVASKKPVRVCDSCFNELTSK